MATTEVPKIPKEDLIDGMPKWEVESAADTLSRAFEIKSNKKLFQAALGVIRKKQEANKKVMGWAGNLNKG